jgi:trimeric autotransporter adhesin
MKIFRLILFLLLGATVTGAFPILGMAAPGDIVTIAGGGIGDNGAASAARLLYPAGVAVDGAGNIYIADQGNNRIRKIAAGTGAIITVAGNGAGGYAGDNGAATDAMLYGPRGIAVDGNGDLYIADYYNNCVRKVATATGIITTVAGNGTAGFSGDNGPASEATLSGPTGVAVDVSGNLYIADQGNNRVRKVSAETGAIATVAGNGTAGYSGDNGAATEASLSLPAAVTIDSAGNLYIADQGNHRIRKVSEKEGIITTVAGNGTAGYSGDNGAAVLAGLNAPSGVAIDAAGNIIIADRSNDRIREVFAGTGVIVSISGMGTSGYSGDKGAALTAAMNRPSAVAIGRDGNIYIADQENYVVRKVIGGSGVIVTVAGGSGTDFSGDNGPATAAGINHPQGMAWDSAGNFYIADSGNNRIRRIAAGTGVISTVAVTDGENLSSPSGTAVDGAGNVYFAERGSHRIRKIAADSGAVSTVAGDGTAAFSGDNGAATGARFNGPSGLAIDGSGNLYVADRGNNRIRRIAAGTGIITTVAGNGAAGYAGDNGTATAAKLNLPSGVAVDSAGNLYIADEMNNRVRKVAAGTVTITTVAGNGTAGYSGDDGPATAAALNRPTGVAVDSAGNIYIADQYNLRVRKVAAGTGIISTFAGNGRRNYSGDNGDATAASLSYPFNVAVDSTGNVFIADSGNNCIREVSKGAIGAREIEAAQNITAAANATAPSSSTPLSTSALTPTANAVALATIPAGATIYDSFTASSSGTLESHTGETGSGWVKKLGQGSAYIDAPRGAVYSRTDVTYYNTGTPRSADYSVIATIHSYTSVGGTNQGVCGRLNVRANSRYFAIFTQGLGWGLYYADGMGHETRIGSLYGARSLTNGRDYRVELRMIGSTISMYVDGVLAASGTSTALTAAGYAGIETAGTGPGTAQEMLDFTVTGAGSGGTGGGTTYTLSYSAGANGTISGNTRQTVATGGSGTQVTAVPNTGYQFVSWSDGVMTASRTDTNVTRNISVTASFALSSGGSGSGATFIRDTFTSGSTVTLESHTAESGSRWVRKTGTGSVYIDPVYDGVYSTPDLTYYSTAVPPSANYTLTATIRAFSAVGGTNIGICGRATSNNARYSALFTQGLGWGLYVADGMGHLTRVGSLYGPTSLTAGRTYSLQLKINGSTISMYVDGILAASGTSTLLASAGSAGVEIDGAGPGAAFEMLDFQATSP